MEICRLSLWIALAAVLTAACGGGPPVETVPPLSSPASVQPPVAEQDEAAATQPEDPPVVNSHEEDPPVTTQANSSAQTWGPFILHPGDTRLDDVPAVNLAPELDPYLELDLYTDARVERFNSLAAVPGGPGAAGVRMPSNVPPGLILSSVSIVRMDGGTLVTSALLWHDSPAFVGDFAPETADLAVTRSLLRPQPAHVILPDALPAGGAVTGWTITPVQVGAHAALLHLFTNDPNADRAGQQRNAVEWFDDEGYINIVSGFGLSGDELIQIAESIR